VADYLDREQLLDLGLDLTVIDRLLADSPLTGHGGRHVIEADRLDDLLRLLQREGSERE
jgi:hypothetical protein